MGYILLNKLQLTQFQHLKFIFQQLLKKSDSNKMPGRETSARRGVCTDQVRKTRRTLRGAELVLLLFTARVRRFLGTFLAGNS